MTREVRMTLLEHLAELRSRALRSLAAFAICSVLSFCFFHETMKQILRAPLDALDPQTTNVFAGHNPVLRWLRPYIYRPGLESRVDLHALTLMEKFIVKFKMALLGGGVLSAPYVLYQVWAFIGAGLLERERRAVLRYLPLSIAMFVVGVLFGYFIVVPIAAIYLLGMDPDIKLVLGYNSYFGLVVVMLAVFGVAFQLPLATLVLARLGLVPAKSLARNRRYAIVIIFIAAAVLTPSPEPFSQCLLAIPMVGLYELGIRLARAGEKKSSS